MWFVAKLLRQTVLCALQLDHFDGASCGLYLGYFDRQSLSEISYSGQKP